MIILSRSIRRMPLSCLASLALVLLFASYPTSLTATEATRRRQRTNRLRGMSRQAVQISRKLKKRQYYSGGPEALEGFVLECEVQLKADLNDGFLSQNDFANFLFDYCGKSDYPGPACQTTNDFWNLDPRLQMIFATEYCDVGPKEQIECLTSLRTQEEDIGYHGNTEKLCESTYRFLKPSGIISSMLRNEDFTDSPDDKKKKKKGSATKVAASLVSAPSFEPTQAPPVSEVGRDSFPPPSAAPTIYTPPAFVEGIIKPGVLGPEEQHQGRTMSKNVSLGFGATVILMLVGTVLVVFLVRRVQFSKIDKEHMSFDPALEGDASILSDNSIMFGERRESRRSEEQSRISEHTSRFWQGKTLVKNMLHRFQIWKNQEKGHGVYDECEGWYTNEKMHKTPGPVDLTLLSLQTYQAETMTNDGTDPKKISASLAGSANGRSDEMSTTGYPLVEDEELSTLMRDALYMNEFTCEEPEVAIDITTSPSTPRSSTQTLESSSMQSISKTSNTKNYDKHAYKGNTVEAPLQEPGGQNTLTSLSMRPSLVSFVRQMKAHLETCSDKSKNEADDQSSSSSETASVKFTVNELKSQFERKRQDEEGSIHVSEDKPVASSVKDLLSQFQSRRKDDSTSVGSADSSNGKLSVKNLRGQFEPPSRRNKRRTSTEMSSQLQELRKQFE